MSAKAWEKSSLVPLWTNAYEIRGFVKWMLIVLFTQTNQIAHFMKTTKRK